MARYLVFSDTHFTRSSEFASLTDDGLTSYLQQCIASMEWVTSQVAALRPDSVVFCGDLFDANEYIDKRGLDVGVSSFVALTEVAKQHSVACYAIVGNHDYWSENPPIHTLRFLTGLGWTVAETPLTAGEIRLLPYRKAIYTAEEIYTQNAVAIFSHVDIVGSRRRAPLSDDDTGAYAEHGVLFDQCALGRIVVNGHYHHPSTVRGNVINVGALTSRTFQDKGSDPRGIIILDSATLEVRRIPNPHASIFSEYVWTSEAGIDQDLGNDLSKTYAKIRYLPHLEEKVQSAREFFAGTRLVPYKPVRAEATALSSDISLPRILDSYVRSRYPTEDVEKLLSLAQAILQEASSSNEAYHARSPIDFGRLSIHYFQSIGIIELDLRNRGLLFLEGINEDDSEQASNGAGKSSIIEAIYWCLTGKSLRGLPVNDVQNWAASYVRVSQEIFQGSTVYRILRSRNDPTYGTGVRVYCDEVEITAQGAARQTQVADILGRSETSLRHVCFMTSEMNERYTRLTRDQSSRLLEDIVDCRPYSVAQTIAKTKKEAASEVRDQWMGSLRSATARREGASLRKQESEKALIQYKAISSQSKALSSKTKDACDLVLVALMRQSEEQRAIEQSCEDDFRCASDKLQQTQRALEQRRAELLPVRAELAAVEVSLRRANNLVSKSCCPECGEPIRRERHLGSIASDTARSQDLQHRTDEVSREVTLLSARSSCASALCAQLQQRISQTRAMLSQIAHEVQTQTRMSHAAELELITLVSSEEKYLSAIAQWDQAAIEATEEEMKARDSFNRLDAEISLLAELQHKVFDESGVRNTLLSTAVVPYMNSRISTYAAHLVGGRDIRIDPDSLEVVSSDRKTYTASSSGERRRVDLLIQFVLNDLAVATGSSRVGLLVVDEVLDRLDEPGLYSAKRVLEQKAESMTVLMISHLRYASAIASHKLTVRKQGGFTTLVDQGGLDA